MTRGQLENSIWGFILGDCWGLPYEFNPPFKGFKPFHGYGTFGKPPMTWSDDTSMMLCLMSSFDGKKFNIKKHKQNLIDWRVKGKFTIDGCFDIGTATQTAISTNFKHIPSAQYGNGALLRTWIALILGDKQFEELYSLTHTFVNNVSSWTDLYNTSYDMMSSYAATDKIRELFNNSSVNNQGFGLSGRSGTVQNAVKTSIEGILNNHSLKEVIEQGYDTDSNAAVYGSLLYINNGIPGEYKKRIRKWEYLERMINTFLDKVFVK